MYMSEFCCYVMLYFWRRSAAVYPMKPGRTRNTRLAESKLKPPFIMSRGTKVISTCWIRETAWELLRRTGHLQPRRGRSHVSGPSGIFFGECGRTGSRTHDIWVKDWGPNHWSKRSAVMQWSGARPVSVRTCMYIFIYLYIHVYIRLARTARANWVARLVHAMACVGGYIIYIYISVYYIYVCNIYNIYMHVCMYIHIWVAALFGVSWASDVLFSRGLSFVCELCRPARWAEAIIYT